MTNPRTLTCCCCSAPTRGRQWWNRDTGYSLCPACADEHYPDPKEAHSMAGVRGVHWDLKEPSK